MDSPVKNDRLTASVALKNKFAAFCSDDEGGASEIVTQIAPIKKLEKTSKKVPQTVTTTISASKNHPKLEKPPTSKNNKEGTRGYDGNRPDGRPRDGNRPEGTVRNGNREGGRPHDGNRPERAAHDGNRPERAVRDVRPRDGNRPEGTVRNGNRDGGRPHDANRQHRPQQHEANEIVDESEEKVNVDRRSNRGDRGTGRHGTRGTDRGGVRGSGRNDRTGVHDAPKKEGHGKGNWGTEKDELQGETEPIDESNAEKLAHDDNADKNDSGVELEKEEEKSIGMTLNEWKEKNKIAEPEMFNIRKPNDDKKLNLAPLKKAEDSNKENEEFVVLRREPREKHVDICVNFASTDHVSGGNRGNRDGFRGRGRGDRSDRGERGGRQERGPRSRNLNVQTRGDDKNQFNLATDQFPALGGH